MKLQQDKSEYLEAATSAMQHFIERERQRHTRKVKKLKQKFAAPEVIKILHKQTQIHRVWTRSMKDLAQSQAQSCRERSNILQQLKAIQVQLLFSLHT